MGHAHPSLAERKSRRARVFRQRRRRRRAAERAYASGNVALTKRLSTPRDNSPVIPISLTTGLETGACSLRMLEPFQRLLFRHDSPRMKPLKGLVLRVRLSTWLNSAVNQSSF